MSIIDYKSGTGRGQNVDSRPDYGVFAAVPISAGIPISAPGFDSVSRFPLFMKLAGLLTY